MAFTGLSDLHEEVHSVQNQDVENPFNYVITLNDLGVNERILLRGPYQATSIRFALPPDWVVDEPITFVIRLASEFQSLLEAFTTDELAEGLSYKKGILTLELNGIKVGEIELYEDLQTNLVFTAPEEVINQDAKENVLIISWDSSIACDHSITTTVSIEQDSRFEIPYKYKEVNLKLKDFPAPFYYAGNLKPYPVAIVLPDDPDVDHLSALLAVTAAFGKLTSGDFSYEVLEANDLHENRYKDYHLVFIGDTAEIDHLIKNKMNGGQVDFPEAITGTDNGYLTYRISPWNPGRVILIISGESGVSLKKSSSVLSAENLLPFSDGNSAVIEDIADLAAVVQFKIDYKLGDLVQKEHMQAVELNETLVEIPFSVPGDFQVSNESYLELYFRHSQLINYLQSNISIQINGTLIGTVRFSDHTAENGLVRIILPPNIIRPLKNTLEISFTITPQDICADARSGNYWITIFGDSYLHLPPILETTAESKLYTLDNLLSGLMRDASFTNLVFVADSGGMQIWEYASQLTYALGKSTVADIIQPTAQFSSSVSEFKTNKDYIIIGEMDMIPDTSGVNNYLPLPFDADGEFIQKSFDGIHYEIDAEQNIGMLESARIQDQRTTILGVFGNSSIGLEVAVKALIEKITLGENENANIEIIDIEGESYYYLIEQDNLMGGEEEDKEIGWIEGLANQYSDKDELVLLIVFAVLTVIFIIWEVRGRV
jgi:hypothetical protein